MLIKETVLLRLIGVGKIPFLFALRPTVLRLDDDVCEVHTKLSYLTSNHVGSMYFGALAAGADCAGGLHAARTIFGLGGPSHRKVVPIFKSLHADFHKLADGDTVFRCEDGRAVTAAVARADESGERITLPVRVIATVPSRYDATPVATFTLELSVKKKVKS